LREQGNGERLAGIGHRIQRQKIPCIESPFQEGY
jgi:hypothetical protein